MDGELTKSRESVKPLRTLKAIVIVVVVTTIAYRLSTFHRLFDNSSTASSKTSTRATLTSGLKDDLDPPSERDDATTTNDNNAPCSFGVFRDHLLRSNTSYLTGDGRWTRLGGSNHSGVHNRPRALRTHLRFNENGKTFVTRVVNGGHLHRFRPALCSLSHGPWLPRSSFANCLCRLNFTFIAIHGDSNAWRLFRLSNKFIVGGESRASATDSAAGGGGERISNGGEKRGGVQCDRVASKESRRRGLPDAFGGGAYLAPRSQQCNIVYQDIHWHLPPDYYRCRVACRGGELSVTVQYLPMTSDWTPYDAFVDPEETGCRNGAPSDGGNETASDRYFARRFTSYQEFLYSEYYAADPSPDLVLHFSSSHDQVSLIEYNAKVEQLAALFRRLQQQQQHQWSSQQRSDDSDRRRRITRTVIISKPAEYVPLKPEEWQKVRYEAKNLTRAKWINATTRILHSKMAPLFTADNRFQNVLLFPDLAAIMNPVIDELAVDGVHASALWYRTLWSYIIQTLCATEF